MMVLSFIPSPRENEYLPIAEADAVQRDRVDGCRAAQSAC